MAGIVGGPGQDTNTGHYLVAWAPWPGAGCKYWALSSASRWIAWQGGGGRRQHVVGDAMLPERLATPRVCVVMDAARWLDAPAGPGQDTTGGDARLRPIRLRPTGLGCRFKV